LDTANISTLVTSSHFKDCTIKIQNTNTRYNLHSCAEISIYYTKESIKVNVKVKIHFRTDREDPEWE